MADLVSTQTSANNHADKMDKMYRTQRHIYDVTRKYYLLGRDQAIAGLNPGAGQSVLELGCGTGRNLVLIARKFPKAKLYGLDISQEMLLQTKKNFARQAIPCPALVAADATRFTPQDFSINGFDRILISYALSMIPDWEKTIEAAITALAPGGSLHIVDFGQQERLPRWFGSLLKSWLAKFHVTPRANLQAVLQDMAKARNCTLQFDAIHRGYAWTAVISVPAHQNA